MKCHCQLISKIRLSKTAKNLNKVFLTCGGSAIESRCRVFSVDPHTDVSHAMASKKKTDKKPYKPVPLKSYNQESWTWLQQAEQNVEQ